MGASKAALRCRSQKGTAEEKLIEHSLDDHPGLLARNELLPTNLRIYNGRRCHMALGGFTPQQRLAQLQA